MPDCPQCKKERAQPRCTDCKWVHEADSIKKTSFMGVGLCPLHAAAPELLEALKLVFNEFEADIQTGHRAEIRALITKAEGR